MQEDSIATIDAIKNEVAKRHNIILDNKDPIFAVVTANEIIMDELIQKADMLFLNHKTELEEYKSTILEELKNKLSTREFEKYKKLFIGELKKLQTPAVIEETTSNTNTIENLKSIAINYLVPSLVSFLIGLLVGIAINLANL